MINTSNTPRSFIVKDENGKQYRRNREHIILKTNVDWGVNRINKIDRNTNTQIQNCVLRPRSKH